MRLFDFFKRTSTPEELYKKQKDKEFMQALGRISFSVDGGRLTVHGLSEEGAYELLNKGEEPKYFAEKVMTAEGKLIPWEEWKKEKDAIYKWYEEFQEHEDG